MTRKLLKNGNSSAYQLWHEYNLEGTDIEWASGLSGAGLRVYGAAFGRQASECQHEPCRLVIYNVSSMTYNCLSSPELDLQRKCATTSQVTTWKVVPVAGKQMEDGSSPTRQQ